MNEILSSPWLTYALVVLNVGLWVTFIIIICKDMFRK